MRRPLAWLSGLAGVWALARLLTGRRSGKRPEPSAREVDPRAEALRRRLAEARAVVDEQEAYASGEVPVDEAEAPASDPDERRRRVHAEGRAAADRMRGDAP